MKLEDLIKNVTGKQLKNFENVEISGISYNSKTTKKGDIFVCLKGEHSDGHEFAPLLLNRLCSAALSLNQTDCPTKRWGSCIFIVFYSASSLIRP